MERIKCYESSYQPLDEVLDRWGDTMASIEKHLQLRRCSTSLFSLQGSVLHKDHGRGPPLPGEPCPRSHPEPNRLLPDEYPHNAAFHLPVSPRRERPQHQRADRRRFWLVFPRKRGVCLTAWILQRFQCFWSVCSLSLSSLPNVWGNSSRSRTSEIWKCGRARWKGPSRRRNAWECRTNSGNLSMK